MRVSLLSKIRVYSTALEVADDSATLLSMSQLPYNFGVTRVKV